ncbi:MAG: VWA domain-containing protein [Candidatus Eisenbacteria bacterium]
MRWEWPFMLLFVLAVPVLFWWSRRPVGRRPAVLWVRVASWGGGGRAWVLRAVEGLPWIALLLALVALGRPQQGLRQSEVETRGVDIVIAIDISPSMGAEDFRPRNRLFVAKETAAEFVRQRPHDRIGVVAFAATAFTQCPLTLDHDSVLELIESLDFGLAQDGTAVGMGLATAVGGLRRSVTPSKVVVLLTDGESNRGAIDPPTAAEMAKALGIKVYAVLVGRGGVVPVPVSDPLRGTRIEMRRMDVDETSMRQIADRTGGRFFRAQDSAALSAIYAEIDRLERAPIRSIEYRQYHDLGPLLLLMAGIVLALHTLLAGTVAFRTP